MIKKSASMDLSGITKPKQIDISPVEEHKLNLSQRIVSASVGALLTSLLVTPLDVVKTRLQAQAPVGVDGCLGSPKNPAQCPKCQFINFSNGLMDHTLPKYVVCNHFNKYYFTGTLDALYKITRYEGIASLYNGLPPTLLMAIPATVIYFATYDGLRLAFEERDFNWMSASLISGSGARILAATTISPLELVRTKMQAMQDPPNMVRTAISQVQRQGFFSLWKGLAPTLLRDVPFSSVYWVTVETVKRQISLSYPNMNHVNKSFLSGAIAGSVAATVTTPFDVIKTRKQVFDLSNDPQANEMRTVKIMKNIIRNEGYGGLFVGLAARIAKISPACALMLGSYEFGKAFFSTVD